MIKSEIIADSLNSKGNRLTTFILEYPRIIHSELLTHRVFSKNAASSRAIPIEKMIQQVIDNPAMPVWWGKNEAGMKAKEELDNVKIRGWCELNEDWGDGEHIDCQGTDLDHAKRIWLQARDKAIKYVKQLNSLGLHKQIGNRILEPWFNIRVILSGTEFENFFALRAHPDAQPELQSLAYKMLEEYNKSQPKKLNEGEWHIPFGDKIDLEKLIIVYAKNETYNLLIQKRTESLEKLKIKIAIARCARVSYFNYEGKDDYESDIKLCDRLFGSVPKHLSPTEHVASAMDNSNWCGNYRGFKQYRKYFENENLSDERVKRYE